MALAKGVAHLPDTSLPWSDTPQRNVYLAGHRMGFRGTWSRMLFYNLDKLGKGDRVVLKDRQGRTYEYRVSETFLVDPNQQWVTGQVRGRDMLTPDVYPDPHLRETPNRACGTPLITASHAITADCRGIDPLHREPSALS